MKTRFIGALFLIPFVAMSQSYSIKGQFWASTLTGNDVPVGQSAYESMVGYIPTLALTQSFQDHALLDLEIAHRFDKSYSGDSLTHKNDNLHRAWIRYSSDKLELRLGLQKIVFGPSQILRVLSWFDTFNLADPTGQTDGVDAFRLRWFPNNNLSVWSWAIRENDEFSLGGRAELSNDMADWGLTVHMDSESNPHSLGQTNMVVSGTNQRVAFDVRYDGYVGLWNESSVILLNNRQLVSTVNGIDYTLPFASGILIISETMSTWDSDTDSPLVLSTISANIPLGMIHNMMWITQANFDTDQWYHYFRWGMTFDAYSLNLMLSMNPKRTEYSRPQDFLPQTVAGFGTGINLMFIYNH